MSIVDHDLPEAFGSSLPDGPLPDLTQREVSVLANIVRGYSHKEIADVLGIALGTVNVFVHRIRRKTGAKSRRDLVCLAARYGISGSAHAEVDQQSDALELSVVEQAWPRVPSSVRAAILSLVQAVRDINPEQVSGSDATFASAN